jgi:Fic family protein
MQRGLQGVYLSNKTTEEHFRAFIPNTLPPNPPIVWSSELREKYDRAMVALGRLDSISVLLPDTDMFIYMYVRKEALLSSMIEGTQSSLSDLLFVELDQPVDVSFDDVKEVCNYVAALGHGLKRLAEGFPFSLRLVKEIHQVLLSTGRGAEHRPGEFRTSQNWIGGTRPGNAVFVPPPPERVLECIGSWELFIHNPEPVPVLAKIAMAHLQFETIHPFLDGNGRVGRLLIPLLLYAENIVREPLLYISYYFKANRQRYYALLNETRLNGCWESWLEFFADAVIITANQAIDTAERLLKMFAADADKIGKLKRVAGSALRIHRCLMMKPIVTPKWVQQQTQLSQATVNACLVRLEQLGVLSAVANRKRNRVYSYTEYVKILNEGTELPD